MDMPHADRITLPEVIDRYLRAQDDRDAEAVLAEFAPGATVLDDGNTYSGREPIRSWLEHAASEYTYTRTLIDAEQHGADRWVVRNRLDGNFPGGVVELAYRFTVHDDQIVHLDIAP